MIRSDGHARRDMQLGGALVQMLGFIVDIEQAFSNSADSRQFVALFQKDSNTAKGADGGCINEHVKRYAAERCSTRVLGRGDFSAIQCLIDTASGRSDGLSSQALASLS